MELTTNTHTNNTKVNLAEAFATITQDYTPRVIAELNGQYVKIARFNGAMPWHSHTGEDEYFQVLKGTITIHLRDRSVTLETGECFVVPKGVEHQPEAQEEAWVLLFEPKATAHTGELQTEMTVSIEAQLAQ